MKLSEVKALLPTLNKVSFKFDNGTTVPAHFHITEIGSVSKKYIDCGGTIRNEQYINFQLWNANDIDHRLKPEKLLAIINLAEQQLHIEDAEIEVEYQADTIGKYGLAFDGSHFILQNKTTACLAPDKCGIPGEKEKIKLSELTNTNCCTPGGGCC